MYLRAFAVAMVILYKITVEPSKVDVLFSQSHDFKNLEPRAHRFGPLSLIWNWNRKRDIAFIIPPPIFDTAKAFLYNRKLRTGDAPWLEWGRRSSTATTKWSCEYQLFLHSCLSTLVLTWLALWKIDLCSRQSRIRADCVRTSWNFVLWYVPRHFLIIHHTYHVLRADDIWKLRFEVIWRKCFELFSMQLFNWHFIHSPSCEFILSQRLTWPKTLNKLLQVSHQKFRLSYCYKAAFLNPKDLKLARCFSNVSTDLVQQGLVNSFS